MVPVLFTLDLPKIIMPQPCFFRKLVGGQSLLCSAALDILSDSFIRKYRQEHLKYMCANGIQNYLSTKHDGVKI